MCCMRSFTQIFIGRALCVLLWTVTGKVTQDRINTHFLLLFCYIFLHAIISKSVTSFVEFEGAEKIYMQNLRVRKFDTCKNRFIFWFQTQINFYHSRNQDHWSSSRIQDVALWETEHWLRVSCYLRSPASNLAHVRS